ncbi:MAG: TolC family protein [Ignavibacteriaceae bacterium]|nr:TolC family protein [Ignavibacteriaceae bacterium]
MNKLYKLLIVVLLAEGTLLSQQKTQSDTIMHRGTLKECIEYAFIHQPFIQQSLLDEEIISHEVNSRLADWFPQLNFNINLIHNYKLPTSIVGGTPVTSGLHNTSSAQFSLTQTIFDRDVFLAASTSKDVSRLMKQKTTFSKIDVVTYVSKAFYSVLFTQEQVALLDEDIVRLQQSEKDTYNQYKGGIVDKTDWERATIALNNAMAEKKQYEELLKSRYAFLKEQMGYPSESYLTLEFDTTKMQSEAFIDTTLKLNYDNRIEYQLLQTQIQLQQANLSYYDLSFVPSISAFGNYTYFYQNDRLSQLYNLNYPYSNIGLQLSLPIFQGGKRIQEIEQASLELKRYKYDIISLKDSINTEYITVVGEYKSNLNNYNILKENLELAMDVYNKIQLQYKSGIKTYLEVITAETDLRTTQANYNNALFQVLSSKLDVQRALGIINIE